MLRRLAVATAFGIASVLLAVTPAASDNCTSEGEEVCECACDKQDSDIRSEGRGTCIVSEAHRNFCRLKWNASGGATAQAADELAVEPQASPVEWPAPALENGSWQVMRRLRDQQGADAEETAIEHLNNIPHEAADDDELLAVLSALIHGHGATTLAGLDVSREIVGRFLDALWWNRDRVLTAFRFRADEADVFEHEGIIVAASRGCVSFEVGATRLMIKSPFARPAWGTCG